MFFTIESLSHTGFFDLHSQVLTHNLNDLFVTWLEAHRFICFLVHSCFQLNDHHHVIIFKNNGLRDLRDCLYAVAHFFLRFEDWASNLITLTECELGAPTLHLHALNEDLINILLYLFTVADNFWLHHKECAVLILDQILQFFKSSFNKIEWSLLL